MSKEEKAKEYAKECALCPTLDGQEEIDKAHREEIERAYIHAYTDTEQDLSAQLTAYKEALNKCITQLKVCRDLLGHEADFIMDLTTTIVEVKFLLNPPCEDVDKKE